MNPRRCETCAFWAENSECRRWPPLYGRVSKSYPGRGPWPDTSPDDWCGEWRLAAEAGEIEAAMHAVAEMEDPSQPFENYTDKGRRLLKMTASLWLATFRRHGLVMILVPKADE